MADCDGPKAFARFDALVRKVLSVPHDEIVRREEEYKQATAMNPNRAVPSASLGSRSPPLRSAAVLSRRATERSVSSTE